MTKKKMMSALVALGLLGSGALAEDAVTPPRKPGTPLKLQIVLSRYQGEKKVASLPYTLSVNTNGSSAKLRVGIQVPLKFEGQSFPGNVVYKSVENQLECKAESAEDSRFRVTCQIEQDAVYAPNGDQKPSGASAGSQMSLLPPILKTFSSEATLTLADGQTGQHVAATDPVTGEIYRVDLTLSVLK